MKSTEGKDSFCVLNDSSCLNHDYIALTCGGLFKMDSFCYFSRSYCRNHTVRPLSAFVCLIVNYKPQVWRNSRIRLFTICQNADDVAEVEEELKNYLKMMRIQVG
jgi:hypothetical protein